MTTRINGGPWMSANTSSDLIPVACDRPPRVLHSSRRAADCWTAFELEGFDENRPFLSSSLKGSSTPESHLKRAVACLRLITSVIRKRRALALAFVLLPAEAHLKASRSSPRSQAPEGSC